MEEKLHDGVRPLEPIQAELKPDVFFCPVRTHLLHSLALMHLAAKRSGTVGTKTKGLVRGGGKKPWRQKGTGRARAGSTRSPIWVGGGTIFGPQSRSYAYRLPKSARLAGLKSALSLKRESGKLVVVEDFDIPQIKTKQLMSLLEPLGVADALLVIPEANDRIEKSARNLPLVEVIQASELNVYRILRRQTLVLTRRSLRLVEERLGG